MDKEIEKAIKKKTDIPKNRFNSDNTLDIKCKLCEESFDKFVDLENHIEVCHEKHNVFQCDKCEKGFVLKWRLKKHIRLHEETNINLAIIETMTGTVPMKNLDASSFVTSTPEKVFQCEDCDDKTQCTDCFVRQETTPLHRVHFPDDE